jgi:hypothetical protein
MRWKCDDLSILVLLVGHAGALVGCRVRATGLGHMQRVHHRVLSVLTLLLDRSQDLSLTFRVSSCLSLFVTAYHITGSG